MIQVHVNEIELIQQSSTKYTTMVGLASALASASITTLVDLQYVVGGVLGVSALIVGGLAVWEFFSHRRIVDRIKSQSVDDRG